MAFGSEVDHTANVIRAKERFKERSVTDITFDEDMTFILRSIAEVYHITGVGKKIEVDQTNLRIFI
jgi:hypothetical protein